MQKIIRNIVLFIISGIVFIFIGGFAILYLTKPVVKTPWHLIHLEEEFNRKNQEEITDFDEYLAMEDRLFKELHQKIYLPSDDRQSDFFRYKSGSHSDPSTMPVNWNRSFELKVDNPKGGVLMVHGLTDSPYSLRSLALRLHAQGFWVVGLRLPGHGTIPAGMLDVHWEDWAAAVRIGARRIAEKTGPDVPFFFWGYSTGASLAVEYALSTIEGEDTPRADGLILLSPAIGLSPVAGLAKFLLIISHIPGLDKFSWESLSLEYDPYKYSSFPINAGKQVWELAVNIQSRIRKHTAADLSSFPDIIAFQSLVDATIQADAIVTRCLNFLPPGQNTLVVYDVNQTLKSQGLLKGRGDKLKSMLLGKNILPFDLEFLTNLTADQNDLKVIKKKSGQSSSLWQRIPYSWPPEIYSLSHVALPFSPDDPVYGNLFSLDSKHVQLGKISLWGEKKVFIIPEDNLIRLRYNPFFEHLADRVHMFLDEKLKPQTKMEP